MRRSNRADKALRHAGYRTDGFTQTSGCKLTASLAIDKRSISPEKVTVGGGVRFQIQDDDCAREWTFESVCVCVCM